MNKFFGVIAASALLAGGAMPALAQMDVAGMTCGAFFAMDAGGRNEGVNAIMNFVKDSANAAAAGTAAQLLQSATPEAALQLVENRCEGQAVDVNLLSVLK
jgi:hypothetical protein